MPTQAEGGGGGTGAGTGAGAGSLRSLTRQSLTRADTAWLALGFVAAALNGLTTAAYAVVIGLVFNGLNSPTGLATEVVLGYVWIGIACAVAAATQVGAFTAVATRASVRLRERFLGVLLRQDVEFFDGFKTGEVAAAFAEDAQAVREAWGEKLGIVVQNTFMFVGSVVVSFVFLWKLALVTLVVIPFIAASVILVVVNSRKHNIQKQQAYSRAGAVAEEAIAQVRTVTALGVQQQRVQAYETHVNEAAGVHAKLGILDGIGAGLQSFTMFSSFGLIYFIGAVFISQSRSDAEATYPLSQSQAFYAAKGKAASAAYNASCAVGALVPTSCVPLTTTGGAPSFFASAADVCACPSCGCGCFPNATIFGLSAAADCFTGGDVMTTFLAILLGSVGLGQMAGPINALTQAKIAAERMMLVLQRKPKIRNAVSSSSSSSAAAAPPSDPTTKATTATSTTGADIRFTDVTFAYPTSPDFVVLDKLNLHLPAGKRTALTGASGSGKSTTVQLLLRFYDPSSGSITVDGIDIRSLDVTQWRKTIGLVSQEPTLFAGTVEENILVGDPQATHEQVVEACRAANALGFVEQFPDAFATKLGNSGMQVSGGQKQRIAIARALLRRPRLLVFDESTSALDAVSEAAVNAAIEAISQSQPCTQLVIAHRLETIRSCDKIVVMVHGQVVEEGTHEELLANKDGAYAALVNAAGPAAPDPAIAAVDDDVSTTSGSGLRLRTAAASTSSKSLMSQSMQRLRRLVSSQPRSSSTSPPGPMAAAAATATTSAAILMEKKPLAPNPDDGNGNADGDGAPTPASDEPKRKTPHVPAYRALRFARPDAAWFAPGLLSAATVGALLPLLALFFAELISTLFLPNSSTMLSQARIWALALFGLGCGGFLAQIGQASVLTGLINGRLTARARVATFGAILKQEIGFFDQTPVGELTAKLSTDASLVKAAVADRAALGVSDVSAIVTGLTISFVGSWQLTLVVLAVSPLVVVGAMLRAALMKDASSKTNERLAAANATVSDAVAGARTVAAFDMRPAVTRVFASQVREALLEPLTTDCVTSGLVYALGQSQRYFVSALTYWYGSTLIAGGLSFNSFVMAQFGVTLALYSVGQSFSNFGDVSKGQAALDSVFTVLDRASAIDATGEASGGGMAPSTVVGDISFTNVSFAYPTRPTVLVLNAFSLTVKAGTVTALVGHSGSGKSSVVGLLARFYDPLAGVVRLDGRDLRTLDVRWLRRQMGVVGQEPVLFDDTVRENVRLGRVDGAAPPTDEEIEEACKAANAHGFITKDLEKGYDTPCGAKGARLSGGQKQRVAIARALVRRPSILLLDEATSALDEESQRVVQAALDDIVRTGKRTTFVVAHRLSTIRTADTIVVVDRGTVVESGTFDELSRKVDGKFAALLRMQQAHSNQ